MKDIILIKGNQHGLTIQLDEEASVEELLECFEDKIKNGRNFFGSAKVTLEFIGKELSDEEENHFIHIINNHSDLEVLCVIDSGDARVLNKRRLIEEIKEEIKNECNLVDTQDKRPSKKVDQAEFVYNTLRSGQQIITDSSLIIMGDVNNGARIESGGSVIVIGKLKGVVHAGINDSENSFVVALDMKPIQLKIGDVIGRSADSRIVDSGTLIPMVAFIEDNRIAMEEIHNQVYKFIRKIKNVT